MRNASVARAAIVVLAIAVMPFAARAEHIVIAGPAWHPAGPGTNTVVFKHTEVESFRCCAGSPVYFFGDGTMGIVFVSINESTQPGTYTGYLLDETTFGFLGTYPVEIEHVGAPPAPPGSSPNTVLTFEHVYPQQGPYVVSWEDCCLGSPQIPSSAPGEVPDPPRGTIDSVLSSAHALLLNEVQHELDTFWFSDVVPLFEDTVQAVSPMGVSGGTATVLAL